MCLVFALCSRQVSLMEVPERPQLANVTPRAMACDDNDNEQLAEDIPVNSLVQSDKQDVIDVADLIDSRADHVTLTCEDGEFEHFEEVQER